MNLKGNWDLYDVFFWVAMCGSFYASQGILHRSRSTIMRQINDLETRLEVKLFKRSYDGIELTDDGEQLFDVVHKLRRELTAIERELRSSASQNQQYDGIF